GLVDEIDETLFEYAAPLQFDPRIRADEGLACLVNPVKNLEESLSLGLWDSLPDRLAEDVSTSHKFVIAGICTLENMGWTAQNAHERRGMLKHIRKTAAFGLDFQQQTVVRGIGTLLIGHFVQSANPLTRLAICPR